MNEMYFAARPSSPSNFSHFRQLIRGREYQITTAGGVFSSQHLDLGTRVLLQVAPEPPVSGTFLDLGCGWGPLTLALASASPAAQVWAVDVNERALELTARNGAEAGLDNISVAPPEAALARLPLGSVDLLWSNPPVRIGKTALQELLLTWLGRLRPGGEAYLVVQKNLGADSLLTWLQGRGPEHGWEAEKFASKKGFRVLRVKT